MNTPAAYAGQSATFALKKVRRSTLRKGMVMVGKQIVPQAIWEFEAEVLVLFHKSTICEKYQAMVHCGNVRQTASIMSIKDASGAETGGDGDARSKAPPLAASTADNVPEASAREGAIREGARSAASNAGSVSTIASTEQNIQSTSSDPKKAIRTGDRAYVRFRFLQYPEYIKPGARILFREGRTKGVGKVTRVFAPGHEHDG